MDEEKGVNRDDIIRMARTVRDGGHWNQLDIVNFGLLVAAHEREACAQVCYSRCPMDGTVSVEVELARAIRARGEA